MRVPRIARRLVRRATPILPQSVLGALVRTLGTSAGPAVGLPAAQRIAVLAPHPDDESLGCGGLVALASRGGVEVTVVFATDGEDMLIAESGGDLATRRREQGTRACEVLGAKAVFLGFPDGRLAETTSELAAALTRVIADIRPDVVVLPWFGDANRDHRALNIAFARTTPAAKLRVWGCEIWSPLPANRVVDISEVVDEKLRAIRMHTADVLIDPDAVLGLHKYRAAIGRSGGTYAEAYFEASGSEYVEWVRSTQDT